MSEKSIATELKERLHKIDEDIADSITAELIKDAQKPFTQKDIIVGEINRIMLKYENIAEDCFQELDEEADGCFYLAKVNVCEEILQFIANMP